MSGGYLVPERYTLVDFEWTDGKWAYAEDFADASLTTKDTNGEIQELKQLAAHEA